MKFNGAKIIHYLESQCIILHVERGIDINKQLFDQAQIRMMANRSLLGFGISIQSSTDPELYSTTVTTTSFVRVNSLFFLLLNHGVSFHAY